MRSTTVLACTAALVQVLSISSASRAFADDDTAPAASSSQAAPIDDEARKLVAEILKAPGGRTPQMCAPGRVVVVNDPSFSPYMFARDGSADVVSAKSFTRLREKREKVIPAIVAALEETTSKLQRSEVSRKPGATPVVCWTFDDATESTQDNLLAMLMDLNAVEALPELVAIYEKLERPGCVLPELDLLSTMTAILRKERYRPLLDSSIEAAFRKVLTDKSTNWLANITDEKDLTANQRETIAIDPILKVAYTFHAYCQIPATRSNKERVVRWAKDFLATTPESKRRGAAGMDPRPIQR